MTRLRCGISVLVALLAVGTAAPSAIVSGEGNDEYLRRFAEQLAGA